MGLYIEIQNTYPCPTCKRILSGWQSKELSYDGYPVAILLQRYKLNKKMTGEMHTTCDNCGFVAYSFSKGKLKPFDR
jgi:hypothetical protein